MGKHCQCPLIFSTLKSGNIQMEHVNITHLCMIEKLLQLILFISILLLCIKITSPTVINGWF